MHTYLYVCSIIYIKTVLIGLFYLIGFVDPQCYSVGLTDGLVDPQSSFDGLSDQGRKATTPVWLPCHNFH